jgi:hypothetical protein
MGFEQESRQEHQTPGLKPGDGSQTEQGGHQPVPQEHDWQAHEGRQGDEGEDSENYSSQEFDYCIHECDSFG